mgnify:CR=1 FL=1
MTDVTIYHNPRCSKSRATLALLEQHDIQPNIVLYLDSPPSETELEAILVKLEMTPRDLMRKGEDAYKENELDNTDLTDRALVTAMVASPILIERPIVVCGSGARIGRPPERVLEVIT